MIRKVFTALLIMATLTSSAQVVIQFVPELSGRTVDGLFNARLLNTSTAPMQVTLAITVSEKSTNKVIQIRTASFILQQGNNTIPATVIRNASIQFSQNNSGTFIRQNHILPEGSYEYCYTVADAEVKTAVFEQCFNYELTPLLPLTLTQPFDKETICEKRPMLSWQPSVPNINGTNYQLILTEIKPNQNATEALRYNLPLISQQGIYAPILPYPSINRDLAEGKTYAWQVTAYKGQTVLNRSEVWKFTVGCEQVEEAVVADNGYRDIESLTKGNYYIAQQYIKFALVNPYSAQPLRYTIRCITDPGEKVKRLPKLELQRGQNKLDIDLLGSKLRDGYSYILDISMPGGGTKSLRFIYKEEPQ